MMALRAMLVDSYRELNSKKLFWVTLVLSGVVVAGLALVGVKNSRLTLLWYETGVPIPEPFNVPAKFYPMVFVSLGHLWLAWIATILGLVSTAGMVPDFIASGAVELVLSKPIGRVRLFLMKYAAGLVFTALQVGVFCAASFVVIGVRAGAWEPRVFLAVPIVVSVFSFLFCVCVLLGLWFRSTIAALMLTLLFWFGIFSVNTTELGILNFKLMNEVQRERLSAAVEQYTRTAANKREESVREAREKALRAAEEKGEPTEGLVKPGDPIPAATEAELDEAYGRLASARRRLREVDRTLGNLRLAHRIAYGVKLPLPKTQETAALLDRYLTEPSGWKPEEEKDKFDVSEVFTPGVQREAQRRLEGEVRGRNLGWVLGTSFAFEGMMLAVSVWMFARRDF